MKHYFAIEAAGLSMKGEWVQQLLMGKGPEELVGFSGKKGLLFSTISLEKFIEEEFRHDRYDLSSGQHRSIRTFSSGEQKKALLEHLIRQQPDFLLLDNPFDCLDTESVDQLRERIIRLAEKLPVIQVFKRKNDLLPFVTQVVRIEDSGRLRIYPLSQYNSQHLHPEEALLNVPVPPPPAPIEIPGEILVELRKVSVSYGENAIVRNISWIIRRGEFWQLTGPNGSGKTTLLSMIYGDNPKAYGVDLFLFGRKKGSGESVWDIKKKIGCFTPSMTELFHRNNTVEQMIISGLNDSIGLYRRATGRQLEIANEWVKLLNLADLKHTSFQKLSQVQQRLVLIARAMIKHPPLLILDEPSTGLDDYSASMLTQLIHQIAAGSQTAILYVSHRKEPGLRPGFRYSLTPDSGGSTGLAERLL